MNIKKVLLLLAVLLLLVKGNTTHAQVTHIPHGIAIAAGATPVSITTGSDAAFCLSINTPTHKSIFIDESANTSVPYTLINAAPTYGIKTTYGKLLINTNTKTWSLYDATGNALISNGNFSTNDSAIQLTYITTGRLYGSGNIATKELQKAGSSSGVDNGLAGIPYYWSTTGYSSFGLSDSDNTPATWQRNAQQQVTWTFPGKAATLYLWPAKTLYAAANEYTRLTGRPKLPPRWAFGYLQSQWGWRDSAYIDTVATTFRSHQLPVDAFIFDFEWYTKTPDYEVPTEGKEGFTDFTFNPKLFPQPGTQIAALKAQGIKCIGIRKPRLANNLLLDTARARHWLIYPGTWRRDLNFSIPSLQQWYAAHNRSLLKAGINAWWDDEGESYYTCYYWWNKTQFDLLASARPNYRHFTLNRAFSPGNQRFGYATWSGDVDATWPALANVPKDLLNYSLAGMYYGACDIGGFQGTPTKELLVRWFQAGVFLPIMRAHSNLGTTPHFPYLWGTDGEAAMRKALNLRYQLLPYTYSLGHEAYTTGAPIMRPLLMEFPEDTAVAGITDEWLLGKGLLAAPILTEGGKRTIYFPAGTWYNYYTGEAINGPQTISVSKALDEIPVYARAGTILPIGPVIQYSEEQSNIPLEIHIYGGKNGTYSLVEDDGTTYNYIKGMVRTTAFVWNDATQTLTWKVNGPYKGNNVYKSIKVIYGKQEKTTAISNGGSIVLNNNHFSKH